MAREIGFTQVSASHEVEPLIKLIGRGDTGVVDAYLSPVLRRYVDQVVAGLGGAGAAVLHAVERRPHRRRRLPRQGRDPLRARPAASSAWRGPRPRPASTMSSASTWAAPRPTSPISPAPTSGPARRAVAGVRVRAPMLEIHTVAAGGGSICHYDGSRFRVGPDSAGAVPGPACYRRGGPLTVTDCNVVLGKIRPEHFPRVFGPGGDQPIDAAASLARCAEIARARPGMAPREVAEGFVRIAVDNMANAIKQISIARGHDVTRYTLQCFGGAGGQHACLVADALGIERVMIHPLAGVLSAYGMGLADMVELRQRTPGRRGSGGGAGRARRRRRRRRCAAQGVEAPEIRRRAALRYEGSDTALEVDGRPTAMRAAFEAAHRTRFGFVAGDARSSSRRRSSRRSGEPPRRNGEGDRRAAMVEGSGAGRAAPLHHRFGMVPLPGCRGGSLRPRHARPRRPHPRPRPDHRPLRHHRRRARLAGRGRPARQPHPHPRHARASAPRRWAPRSIRSCSR